MITSILRWIYIFQAPSLVLTFFTLTVPEVTKGAIIIINVIL